MATFPLYPIGQSRQALWGFLGGWLRPQGSDEGVSSPSWPGPMHVSTLSSLPPIWADPQRWPSGLKVGAVGVGAVGSALGCQGEGGGSCNASFPGAGHSLPQASMGHLYLS